MQEPSFDLTAAGNEDEDEMLKRAIALSLEEELRRQERQEAREARALALYHVALALSLVTAALALWIG